MLKIKTKCYIRVTELLTVVGGDNGDVGVLCGLGDCTTEISTSTGSSFGLETTVLKPFLAFGTLWGIGVDEDKGMTLGDEMRRGTAAGAEGDTGGDGAVGSGSLRESLCWAITLRRVAMGEPRTVHSVMPIWRRWERAWLARHWLLLNVSWQNSQESFLNDWPGT